MQIRVNYFISRNKVAIARNKIEMIDRAIIRAIICRIIVIVIGMLGGWGVFDEASPKSHFCEEGEGGGGCQNQRESNYGPKTDVKLVKDNYLLA